MDEKRLIDLLSKKVQHILTEQEAHELESWANDSYANRKLYEYYLNKRNVLTDLVNVHRSEAVTKRNEPTFERALDDYYRKNQQNKRRTPIIEIFQHTFTKVAAVLLLIAGAGLWAYWAHNRNSVTTPNNIASNADVLPGGNKAVLTLADGRKIDLGSASNNKLASQGAVDIVKLDSAKIAYTMQGTDQKSNAQITQVQYNTIETPRGGQYQIVLPDGTKVWLDAASSLKFPIAFTGHERLVTLEGQAYFDVAKDPKMPFIVKTSKMRVQVLGTKFDVKAYAEDKQTQTTLIQGAVKVEAGGKASTLRPGQRATLDNSGVVTVKQDEDFEDDIAWVDGLFEFRRSDIGSVMSQLARWYNVEIVYQNTPTITFTGEIRRDSKLSDVLAALKASEGVNFKIDGRKIIVLR